MSGVEAPRNASCVVADVPLSVIMLRCLWEEYRFVLPLDWSVVASRLTSPPDWPRFMSATTPDLEPASIDADDSTDPDFALSALDDDLEYVTTRVTGGMISGANGANNTHTQQLTLLSQETLIEHQFSYSRQIHTDKHYCIITEDMHWVISMTSMAKHCCTATQKLLSRRKGKVI